MTAVKRAEGRAEEELLRFESDSFLKKKMCKDFRKCRRSSSRMEP